MLGVQPNQPYSLLTSIPSTGCFRARNAAYERQRKLYVQICAVVHKETLSVVITKMATYVANYVNHVHRTILYYIMLHYTVPNDISFI
jgi:hypothetical protein